LASHYVEVLGGLWSVGCSTSSCAVGLGLHSAVWRVTLSAAKTTATTTADAATAAATGGATGGATDAAAVAARCQAALCAHCCSLPH
jgi:hypothetical protein